MIEERFFDTLTGFTRDPLKFVAFAFPWGEAGSELARAKGPEPWQSRVLAKIRDGMSIHSALQLATTSGHGVGKSALVSWIILWALATYPDTRGVVTANTEVQLKTKTWAELAKWFRLFAWNHPEIGELFRYEATCIFSRDREHEKTWRVDMVPWSERNTEAFAGLHNKGRRILVVFDEASAIPDTIWETTEGALTDSETEILWTVFGNPTRNSGRFKECFPGGRYSHRWSTQAVDSREVSLTDKAQIGRWIDDYGVDSDFVRVRVRGMFPRIDAISFIGRELAVESSLREVQSFIHDPLTIGVDVARFGDDASVIFFRKGRDARSIPPIVLRGVDTMQLAARIAEENLRLRPDAIFIDGGGVGGGVVDRCRQLRIPVFEVQFGGKSDRSDPTAEQSRYANKRAEMWGYLREWLSVGAIPEDEELITELTGPLYALNARDEIQLERKEDMKKRGVSSPDRADGLALTFAYPVMPNSEAGREGPHPPPVEFEYDPFDHLKEVVRGFS